MWLYADRQRVVYTDGGTYLGETDCSGTTKMQLQYHQYSNDSGATWITIQGDTQWRVLEADSTDCGYDPNQYRWKESGYTCSGYTKYLKEQYQMCSGNCEQESSWSAVTSASPRYTFVENNSEYCGYEPTYEYDWELSNETTCIIDPMDGIKSYVVDNDGTEYYDYCGGSNCCCNIFTPSSSAITQCDISHYSTENSCSIGNSKWAVSYVFGDCVEEIADSAFTFYRDGTIIKTINTRKDSVYNTSFFS